MNALPVDAVAALRLRLHANGYHPVPVTSPDAPITSAGKRPNLHGWDRLATADPDAIRLWSLAHPDHPGTGIFCGELIGLDLDIPHADLEQIRFNPAHILQQ